MKVSIIMPIYNAEKYLAKSLDSIISQNYKNLEIILINDGSTDRSRDIAEEYKAKDRRIILVDIENSGPCRARNKGLELATGKYISFVDADDWLTKNAIRSLMSIAYRGYDVVASNHYRVESTIEISKNDNESGDIDRDGSREEKNNYKSFKTTSSFGYVWGKLYKNSFIQVNDIKFNEDRKVFLEDTLFNLKVMANNPKYYFENTPTYYYNIIGDSLSNTKEEITDRAIKVLEDYESFLDKNHIYDKNLDLFIALATRTISWSLFKSMDCNFSFKNLRDKVKMFSNNRSINRLFNNKKSLKKLRTIDSTIQIIFYSFIVICIRYKLETLLSLIFYIFYPTFKRYILRVVKA